MSTYAITRFDMKGEEVGRSKDLTFPQLLGALEVATGLPFDEMGDGTGLNSEAWIRRAYPLDEAILLIERVGE